MSSEKHTEQVDLANSLVEEFTASHVARIRGLNKPEQVKNEDGTWPHEECIDCDEPIPEGRLNLGKVRCIECQSLRERHAR